MRHRVTLLVVLGLLAAGCGAGNGFRGGDTAPTTVSPIPGSTAPSRVADPDTLDAGLGRDAIAEPAFKPAPEPAPSPEPKTARPALPTPPERSRRVPPGVDARPPALLSPDDGRVVRAVVDLADRLGMDPTGIDVLDARLVTWRDGSAGCPDPDLAYSHALVSGVLIVLRAGNTSYRYHAAGDLTPSYCPTPQPPLEGGA